MGCESPLKPKVVIALDVGGTFIKSGLVVDGELLQASCKQYPALADQDADVIIEQFISIFEDQYQFYTVTLGIAADCTWCIGLAFPGPFDYQQGICYIQGLSKYEALYGENIREVLYTRFKTIQHKERAKHLLQADIRFENDAKLFALGVSRLFPNERYISLTIGTGLGSAFIDHASLLNEGPGVPKDGWLYDKPFLESSIDDALSRRGILRLAEQMGALEKGMDVKELAEHARNGNSMSCKVFEEFGTRLAEMLKSYVVEYQPTRIVIGGQISKSIDLFGPALQTGLADSSIVIFTSENVSEFTLIGISRLFDNSLGLR